MVLAQVVPEGVCAGGVVRLSRSTRFYPVQNSGHVKNWAGFGWASVALFDRAE